MRPLNSEQYIINFNERYKNDKKGLFLKCLKTSNSLYYLEKEDIINFSKCSKTTNKLVEDNNLLFLYLLNNNQLQ